MREIVINKRFGGFGLSEAAMHRYAELKGITLYPEPHEKFSTIMGPTYWIVPVEQRVKPLPDPWGSNSIEARIAYNEKVASQVLADREIRRDDPDLVRVVRELGEIANGRCADLAVVSIPDDVDWEIEEYDGREWVSEKHRTWSAE